MKQSIKFKRRLRTIKSKTYKIKLQGNIALDTILKKYDLEALKDDDKKPNFAIIKRKIKLFW